MSIPNQDRPVPGTEYLFIHSALAQVERAERFQRFKQIIVSVLAFAYAFWFAFQAPSSQLDTECVIVIFVGLMLAVCTAKILSLINRNTKAILQAIADTHER